MKCKKCGAEIDSDSKFCTECGTPVEENLSTVKQNSIQTQENGFKQDTPKKKLEKKAKYHYGFSYVRIFRIWWAVLAIVIAIIGIAIFSFISNGGGMASILGVLGSLLIGLLVYWLGMFSIKRFENIAITAKMLTDIRNKIFDNDEKLKK